VSRSRCVFGAAAVASILTSLTGELRANGRFPQATQVVFGRGGSIALRATYGLVWLQPRTSTWSWVCEGAIGYGGVYDPPLAFAGDTLVLGLEHGVSRSRDGCTWSHGAGAARASAIVDVTVDPARPERIVAISAPEGHGEEARARVLESTDAGVTWRVAGLLPAGIHAETIELAPSLPGRIYISGTGPGPGSGMIARSDDRGATWRAFPFPLPRYARAPYLGPVDPRRPDTLYVRIDGDAGDSVAVSRDGGSTLHTIFDAQAELLGLALSPDGEHIAVGGPLDGIRVATTRDLSFHATTTTGITCLAWTQEGLFACGLEPAVDFGLGVSHDEGASFAPLYRARDLAPRACAGHGSVTQRCASEWAQLRAVLSPLDAAPGELSPIEAHAEEAPRAEPSLPSRAFAASSAKWLALAGGALAATCALILCCRRKLG
jgi:hypothetical protein